MYTLRLTGRGTSIMVAEVAVKEDAIMCFHQLVTVYPELKLLDAEGNGVEVEPAIKLRARELAKHVRDTDTLIKAVKQLRLEFPTSGITEAKDLLECFLDTSYSYWGHARLKRAYTFKD